MHDVAAVGLGGQTLGRERNQPLDRGAQHVDDRGVQPFELGLVELGRPGVRREHRGVQDLVGKGPADTGDRPLVAQKSVQQVRMLVGLACQHLDGERRIERLGADVGKLLGELCR